MTRRKGTGRSGITLTEILISILILGVGMISLATLFPLGLLRLRNAGRMSRSAYLSQSAGADLSARNLLAKYSFVNRFTTPYFTNPSGVYDPWVQDTPAYGTDWLGANPPASSGAYRGGGGNPFNAPFYPAAPKTGPGLPVAYDPLWRFQTGVFQNNSTTPAGSEARFGSGIGFLRGTPGAHGLQRITNFLTPALAASVPETFVSPEDIVFQDLKGQYLDPSGNAPRLGTPSPLVPDLSQVQAGAGMALSPTITLYPPQSDWRFTWLFTGQQTDSFESSIYDGHIVVMENRQFGNDTVQSPFGGPVSRPTGETVVEAVWGYGTNVATGFNVSPSTPANLGYARSAKRTVLLLWPSTTPDPDVRVGQWIADVTYERSEAQASANYYAVGALYPPQRCYWYQIAKRTEASNAAVAFVPAGYRQMTVWVSNDLRAQSMMSTASTPAAPANIEAALLCPTVVNVIPRTVYTHGGSGR